MENAFEEGGRGSYSLEDGDTRDGRLERDGEVLVTDSPLSSSRRENNLRLRLQSWRITILA